MNKNVFVAPGIIVGTLLAIGVAIVIYGSIQSPSSTEPEYNITPTRWSGEEDYKIEETPQGTRITNTEVGFSFIAPKNWSIDSNYYDLDTYVYEFGSPNIERMQDENGNQFGLLKGCGMDVLTVFQELDAGSAKSGIASIIRDPASAVTSDGTIKDEVIQVDGYQTLKTTTNPTPEIFRKAGKFIWVKIPISDVILIDISLRMMPESEGACVPAFDDFLASFSIQ